MAKNVKNASKAQAEGLKYVPMRKAARAMTFVAGVLSSGIVVFSVAEAAWAWAAVFAAMAAVAFYLAYAMTIDLHEGTELARHRASYWWGQIPTYALRFQA